MDVVVNQTEGPAGDFIVTAGAANTIDNISIFIQFSLLGLSSQPLGADLTAETTAFFAATSPQPRIFALPQLDLSQAQSLLRVLDVTNACEVLLQVEFDQQLLGVTGIDDLRVDQLADGVLRSKLLKLVA